MLYTSRPNADAQSTVDAFTAKHPYVTVERVHDGTTKLMAELRAEFEAGAPRPDLPVIAVMATRERLELEGLIIAYPAADIADYDPDIIKSLGPLFLRKADYGGLCP